MRPDGSGVTRLTNFKKLKPKKAFNLANNPVWSPTGTQIMFTHFAPERNRLAIMNADGTGLGVVPLAGKNFDNRIDWGPLPTP